MYQCLSLNDYLSGFGFSRKSADVSLSEFSEGQGTVVNAIEPGKKGRIRLHGVFWFACTKSGKYETIPEGSLVVGVGRVGNTLIVQPATATVSLKSY